MGGNGKSTRGSGRLAVRMSVCLVRLRRKKKGGAEECVFQSSTCCKWARAKWDFPDVTQRRSVWEGLVELKLLQHLLLSMRADKRVLFKEASILWGNLSIGLHRTCSIHQGFYAGFLTSLVRAPLGSISHSTVILKKVFCQVYLNFFSLSLSLSTGIKLIIFDIRFLKGLCEKMSLLSFSCLEFI